MAFILFYFVDVRAASTIAYFKEHSLPLTFDIFDANLFVDIDTKRAASKASSSVVSLISYTGAFYRVRTVLYLIRV